MKSPFLIASAGLIAIASLGFTPAAFADEVTTKTTTTKTTEPAGVVVGAPAVGGVVVKEDGGCATKKVTKTNDEGDTATKTKTNCD